MAYKMHSSATTYLGFLVGYCLLTSVMRAFLQSHEDFTHVVFWLCCAALIGSGARILTSIFWALLFNVCCALLCQLTELLI